MNGEAFRGTFYDVRTIDVSLSRLSPDSPDTCPMPWEELIEHLTTESDDGKLTPLVNPQFIRTAKIGETQYWIWAFDDPRRGGGYLLVALWPGGNTLVDCDDTFDMTPEQYLLAQHFQLQA